MLGYRVRFANLNFFLKVCCNGKTLQIPKITGYFKCYTPDSDSRHGKLTPTGSNNFSPPTGFAPIPNLAIFCAYVAAKRVVLCSCSCRLEVHQFTS